MQESMNPPGTVADFAPRHFYYSRYLCATNALGWGSWTIWVIRAIVSPNPAEALLALPSAAWTYVCLRELFQRKPAITVSAEGIVIRKLIFANADMHFDNIKKITTVDNAGGVQFKFHLKSSYKSYTYAIHIYNNVHLNCSIEAGRVVEAIRAARPDVNLHED